MIIFPQPNYIKCSSCSDKKEALKIYKGNVDIFFAETQDLASKYPDLKNYISSYEQLRANKFHSNNNRETYITCHAMLRLVLSHCLNINPLEISYKIGINNKPGLSGNPVYFNLTHTNEAFAFAVSRDFYVGLDLENIIQDIDIHSISTQFFSKKECSFILKSETGAKSRFFKLWTRKEALLKALGTGIINNLPQIEVSGRNNLINKKSFEDLEFDFPFNNLFLYSKKINKYYLSIAIPQKASLNFHNLSSDSIVPYLDKQIMYAIS